MKKTLLFLITLFSFSLLSAQGNNLQFNRALYENYSISATSGYDYYTLTNAFTYQKIRSEGYHLLEV